MNANAYPFLTPSLQEIKHFSVYWFLIWCKLDGVGTVDNIQCNYDNDNYDNVIMNQYNN